MKYCQLTEIFIHNYCKFTLVADSLRLRGVDTQLAFASYKKMAIVKIYFS